MPIMVRVCFPSYLVGYLRIMISCLTEVTQPNMNAGDILVANVYRVYKRAVDAMGDIQEYLKQGKIAQTMDSKLEKNRR